jgi:hypothetical protein
LMHFFNPPGIPPPSSRVLFKGVTPNADDGS